MTIRVLYFDDCPNYQRTVELVEQTVDDMGVDAEIELVHIDSVESAKANRFLGSPTIQIDGRDIDPAARGRLDFGVSCRRYGASGTPPREMLVCAIADDGGGAR